jgi:asparagine synthetase B (glutamine-hydrolysing)
LALSKIARRAHSEGRKVYLSGQGADEIISDYALWPKQSTFKGKFPDDLSLWENFYDFCQYNYLGKEEYVAGSHSVETRYPFLDEAVVQEFLWLTPELKNKHYKAPIYEYLKRFDFPVAKDIKIGLGVRA